MSAEVSRNTVIALVKCDEFYKIRNITVVESTWKDLFKKKSCLKKPKQNTYFFKVFFN